LDSNDDYLGFVNNYGNSGSVRCVQPSD
ncbi:unnamed protein product, partial [Rotaria magnacalcarata]